MPVRRLSIATVVAATLVAVTTILLGAFGLTRYVIDRSDKWARLRAVTRVQADVLSVSLALPIWNIDRAQVDKIIEGMGSSPSVEAIVVIGAGQTQSWARQGNWLMPSDGKFPTGGLVLEERPIVFSNQRIGTVRVYGTPRLIRAELRQSLIRMVATILILDVLLVLSVYFVLWRTVLRPVVAIEKYAVAVSAGREPERPQERAVFSEELEALRTSIETMVHDLTEGELRFRTIFDSANDAIFLTDPTSGRFLDVNARIAE